MHNVNLIFRFHQQSRYSAAAILGSVESDVRLTGVRMSAPFEFELGQIERSLRSGLVVIAQSVMSTQFDRVKEEVGAIRKEFGNEVLLIAGGPHASARPETLLNTGFDYVVIGEGEKTIRELLWALMTDEDPSSIVGVVSAPMEVYPTPHMLPKVELDDYPPFALDLNVVGPIEVTRGCPFRCKFCSMPFLGGGKVRHRSVDSVEKWLRLAVEKRGFNRAWFLSPNALSYGGRGRYSELNQLSHLLKRATAIEGLQELYFGSFPSEVRPEFVNECVLELLRQYVANETLQIGLQSGSDRILERTNRHHTVQDGMNAVRIALDSGFTPNVDMIFGLPGENEKDLSNSIAICEHLVSMGAKIHGHVFMPLPGSEFENMPPGSLDANTRGVLGELARKGHLTGSWSIQEQLAVELGDTD